MEAQLSVAGAAAGAAQVQASGAAAGAAGAAGAAAGPRVVQHVTEYSGGGGGGGGGGGRIPSDLGEFLTVLNTGFQNGEIKRDGTRFIVVRNRYHELAKIVTEEINLFIKKKDEFLENLDINNSLVSEMFDLLKTITAFNECIPEPINPETTFATMVEVTRVIFNYVIKGNVEGNYETALQNFNETVNEWVKNYVNRLLEPEVVADKKLKIDIERIFEKFKLNSFPLDDKRLSKNFYELRKKFEIKDYLTYGVEMLDLKRTNFIERFDDFFFKLFNFYKDNNLLEVNFSNVHVINPLDEKPKTLDDILRNEDRDNGYLDVLKEANCEFMLILHLCKKVSGDFTSREIKGSKALQFLKAHIKDSCVDDSEKLGKFKDLWPKLFDINPSEGIV
jgi:hypothetical protein